MDHNYIAHQIDFIQKASTRPNTKELIENAKWRIASHAEFPNLDMAGSLTEEQKNQVNQFILKFANSPSGKNALSEIKVEVNHDYFRNSNSLL